METKRLALSDQDIMGMAAADAQSHDLLFELCGNPVLAGMYRPVRDLMVETQRLPMMCWTRLEEILLEYVDLLRKIAAREAMVADLSMKHNIRSAARRYDIEI